jgi:hypothetical protein
MIATVPYMLSARYTSVSTELQYLQREGRKGERKERKKKKKRNKKLLTVALTST